MFRATRPGLQTRVRRFRTNSRGGQLSAPAGSAAPRVGPSSRADAGGGPHDGAPLSRPVDGSSEAGSDDALNGKGRDPRQRPGPGGSRPGPRGGEWASRAGRRGRTPSRARPGRNQPQSPARKAVFVPFYLIIRLHRNMILFTNIQVRDCWSKPSTESVIENARTKAAAASDARGWGRTPGPRCVSGGAGLHVFGGGEHRPDFGHEVLWGGGGTRP